ncbi:MAG: MaoC family dehydratase [Chloroflexota bacterium]
MDLRQVQVGYAFPRQTLILDEATVAAYVEAVEDPSPLYRGPEALVPPLAILALSMRGLTDLLLRYPGATHASQRLTATRPARLGDTVTADLTVRARSERRGFAALILEVRIEDGPGAVLDGEMLLMVPLREGGAAND